MQNLKFNFKNITLLSLLFFLLLFFKRWNQLLDPEIWIEDGIYGIPTFIHHGWSDLFMEEGGFLKTINVLITNTGLTISPLYYPEISTYLAWLFMIFVSLAVVYSPTKLRYKFLAAVLIYFIPTGLENFGIPYYSYFWAGILLFLVLLWEPGKNLYLRVFYIFLGGLSSPIVFMLLPLQIFRVIFIQKYRKDEIVALIVTIFVFYIQYHFFATDGYTGSKLSIILSNILEFVRKFYGLYYLNYLVDKNLIQLYGGLLILVLFLLYWIQNIKDKYFYIIMALLIGTGLSAVLRKYIQIDPISPGSRYFFYPYIMLTWSLLYISGAKQRWFRFFAIPIILLSIIVSFNYPYRTHDKLSYKKYLIACSNPKNGLTKIPEHINGGKDRIYPWSFTLTSNECKRLLQKGLFDIPNNLKVLEKNLFNLQKIKLPGEIKYKILLKDLQKDSNRTFTFTKSSYIKKPLVLLKELDKIRFAVKGEIFSDKIATLYIKIGNQIIFIDETVNSSENRITLDDKIVFSDFKEGILEELYNKESNLTLCAINKKGTGYYELFNIPIYITDIKSIFNKLPKVTNKEFMFDVNKFDQVDGVLRFAGWFTEVDHNLSTSMIKTPVVIELDDKLFISNNLSRKDLVVAFKNPKYLFSGFSFYMPINKMSVGEHIIKIYGLSYDRKRFFTPKKVWKFNVSSDKKNIIISK